MTPCAPAFESTWRAALAVQCHENQVTAHLDDVQRDAADVRTIGALCDVAARWERASEEWKHLVVLAPVE